MAHHDARRPLPRPSPQCRARASVPGAVPEFPDSAGRAFPECLPTRGAQCIAADSGGQGTGRAMGFVVGQRRPQQRDRPISGDLARRAAGEMGDPGESGGIREGTGCVAPRLLAAVPTAMIAGRSGRPGFWGRKAPCAPSAVSSFTRTLGRILQSGRPDPSFPRKVARNGIIFSWPDPAFSGFSSSFSRWACPPCRRRRNRALTANSGYLPGVFLK